MCDASELLRKFGGHSTTVTSVRASGHYKLLCQGPHSKTGKRATCIGCLFIKFKNLASRKLLSLLHYIREQRFPLCSREFSQRNDAPSGCCAALANVFCSRLHSRQRSPRRVDLLIAHSFCKRPQPCKSLSLLSERAGHLRVSPSPFLQRKRAHKPLPVRRYVPTLSIKT